MIVSFLVTVYLAAIVAADLIVTKMGARGLIVTGLFLIPFDLISRDQLQDMWRGSSLKKKMAALICSGSIIAFLINPDAKNVAIASAAGFMIAGTVDYLIYSVLIDRPKLLKMNVSNIFASMADSISFQLIAFGAVNFEIAGTQTALKIVGGFFWSLLFIQAFKTYLARPRN